MFHPGAIDVLLGKPAKAMLSHKGIRCNKLDYNSPVIAGLIGLSQAEVLNLCDDLNIPRLSLQTEPGRASTIFVSMRHAPLLGIKPTILEAA